ncbi:hypothetical protein Goshw_022206 [Gossypium schwendimanii]|uniref:Ribosomal protein L19 n=1 Tax=Gossypium schwendimanii TaxID=34291 RepID=A0A7J9KMS6_GOSSC|nr:hypothetical protein [Gossypium schwendimanii]
MYYVVTRRTSYVRIPDEASASSIATGLDQAPFPLAVGGGMVPTLQGGVISPIGGAVSRYSPNIKEIKVLDKKKVRRAKLYYLRNKMNALR